MKHIGLLLITMLLGCSNDETREITSAESSELASLGSELLKLRAVVKLAVVKNGEGARYTIALDHPNIRVIQDEDPLCDVLEVNGKLFDFRTGLTESDALETLGPNLFPDNMAHPTNPWVVVTTGLDGFLLSHGVDSYQSSWNDKQNVRFNTRTGFYRTTFRASEGSQWGDRLLNENGEIVECNSGSIIDRESITTIERRISWATFRGARLPSRVQKTYGDELTTTTFDWISFDPPDYLFDPTTLGKVDAETLELKKLVEPVVDGP